MAADSKIEWTDATWTPIRARTIEVQDDGSGRERLGWHCEKVSAGCKNCYAEPINRRLGTGLDYKPGHLRRAVPDSGTLRANVTGFLDESMLLAPLRWRKPRMIFVCSMTDLFADFVDDEWIDRMFAVMALCPQHTFQVLTKRPERMRKYLTDPASAGRTLDVASVLLRRHFDIPDNVPAEMLAALDPFPWPLPHIWLGVSVEDQAAADARIPHLLAVPAKVRFLSCEPLLGPVDLRRVEASATGNLIEGTFAYPKRIDALTGKAGHYPGKSTFHPDSHTIAAIDWVICGGESGPGARPMHPAWARALRDQCAAAAGVAFFMKQMTKKAPIPADLMVREFPDAR